jgi:hypothetical protein
MGFESLEISEARQRFGRAVGEAVQILAAHERDACVRVLNELAKASRELAEALSR